VLAVGTPSAQSRSQARKGLSGAAWARFRRASPAIGATQEMLRRRINKVLKTLSYREREIIKLRYGLGDGYSYTLEEVGLIFKVTRERIRQIEAKAVRKLQQPSRSQELVGFLD
jgi:RNA polymerase primary sigma factor